MFLTGFIVGSVIIYLICSEEAIFPQSGRIGAALLAGLLTGLITMMVQYVGLFLTGFCTGLFMSTAAFIVVNFFYTPSSLWLPLGVMFLTGVVFAVASLYFQKGLTILGTALLGSALMCVAVDYYVHVLTVVYYVWDVIRARDDLLFCWYYWLVLASWPTLFLVGFVIQWCVTGKDVDHREGTTAYC